MSIVWDYVLLVEKVHGNSMLRK